MFIMTVLAVCWPCRITANTSRAGPSAELGGSLVDMFDFDVCCSYSLRKCTVQ